MRTPTRNQVKKYLASRPLKPGQKIMKVQMTVLFVTTESFSEVKDKALKAMASMAHVDDRFRGMPFEIEDMSS
jgi:hypothetical protein